MRVRKADEHDLSDLPKRKPGRPPTDVEYKEAKIRLLPEEWDHMKALAECRDYSFSVMARIAIRKYIRENSVKKRFSSVK